MAVPDFFCPIAATFKSLIIAFIARAVVLALAVACQITLATAAVVLPSDLEPGSLYQLVFVTKGAQDAFGGLVRYTGFVREEAWQNVWDLPFAGWNPVVSTGGNAQGSAPVYATIPIYNTAGQRVAASGPDFYSDFHDYAITFDQFGDVRISPVWTGIHPWGDPAEHLGPYEGPAQHASTYGLSDDPSGRWANAGSKPDRTELLPLYALSDPIVFVPEPSIYAAAIAGLICGVVALSRRRRG